MLWLFHSGFITGKVFYFQYNLQYILPGMTLFFVGRHSLCPAHLLSIALANHGIYNIISVLRIRQQGLTCIHGYTYATHEPSFGR